MKHYVGERTQEGCTVDVLDSAASGGGYQLNPRHDLRNHSDAYNWGYGGSGPAQLALALLADALGNDEKAQRYYQDFKFRVIGRLDSDSWDLSQEDIRQTMAALEAEGGETHMTTDPQPDPAQANQQLRVENSLLRASLFLAARVLKDYHDAKHIKTEQEGIVQLTVPESLKTRAADAFARADRMLKDQDRGIRI